MLDRRRLLMTAAGATALATTAGRALAQAAPAPASGEAAKLNALFDKIFKTEVSLSPEFQTGLGMEMPGSKAKLDDRSLAAEKASIERQKSYDRDLTTTDEEFEAEAKRLLGSAP